MSVAERNEEIKEMVCEILEIEEEEITETSLFKEDHDADSLRAIEILASLERNFKAKIPQDELVRMVNLKGIYEVVDEFVAQ
ncbi:acyl carrier protein [Aliikangiella sp. IMCC44359]|uniref:acyl carrier protein n=1 Tax=Aliikangiella sp. IMCC44359 TaxID=3459125 RepID=UPI00403ADFDA